MWDQTTLSGELEDQELLVKLGCGLEMKVSVGLLEEYTQPAPSLLPPGRGDREARWKLSAEDWNQRDEAQKKLAAMGPVVINLIKGLKDKQSPEGQQRIDQVIVEIEKAEHPEAAASAGDPNAANPPMLMTDSSDSQRLKRIASLYCSSN